MDITVANVAETNPPKPINGLDFALSALIVAMILKATKTSVLKINVDVTANLLFSISHAGVFETNIPT